MGHGFPEDSGLVTPSCRLERRGTRLPAVVVCALAVSTLAWHAAARGSLTVCKMQFDLRGWSAIYQTAKGSGWVRCRNGQSSAATAASPA
jgi:hypothetical protein